MPFPQERTFLPMIHSGPAPVLPGLFLVPPEPLKRDTALANPLRKSFSRTRAEA